MSAFVAGAGGAGAAAEAGETGAGVADVAVEDGAGESDFGGFVLGLISVVSPVPGPSTTPDLGRPTAARGLRVFPATAPCSAFHQNRAME
jgi:hypothetical protein